MTDKHRIHCNMSQNVCKERSRQHQDLVLVKLTHVRRVHAAISHSIYVAEGTKQERWHPWQAIE